MRGKLFQFLIGCVLINTLPGCNSKEGQRLNRLSKASSPYLQEHADNPVDWYEWGDEALDKAQREGKPILVSIGYASCHWCHVMEEETFMDTAVARIMNENFVSIKIDREERPDIDQIYVNAAQLISGNAGWPLNAFAMPDGKPFFAATYFPKKQWVGLLQQIVEAFANEHENLSRQADALTKGIQSQDQITFSDDKSDFNGSGYLTIFETWQGDFDFSNGGLKGAPKFPMPVVWEFLLQHHFLTGDTSALKLVTTTLDKISQGGIYDHLAGGFARYATDSLWKIPHFEKMLYDNGQLVSLYSKAFQVTKDPDYEKVVRETLEFIGTEMTSPEGGFYSSLNADSEGEEGKFYVWTKEEVEKALGGETAKVFMDYYHVTGEGNWEQGKNILFVDQSSKAGEVELTKARKDLLSYRNTRIRPTTDNKILTAWNALMLAGYINAYIAFQHDDYLNAALTNARFLDKDRVDDNGHVWRSKSEGHPPIEGFLDDYALLAKCYLQMYQATFDIHWLARAKTITNYVLDHFRDQQSGLFYYTLDRSAQEIAKKIETADQVIPSSNSVMAEVLYLLGEYYGEDRYTDLSRDLLARISETMTSQGPYYANWAKLTGLISYQPYQVAIVGPDALSKRKQLQQKYLPTALLMGGPDENLPLLENKRIEGKTIIYVCRNRVCKLPVEDVDKAIAQIE